MSASRSWAAPNLRQDLSNCRTPSDDGYLLLTYAFARGAGHIIKLNDRDFPWVDIFPSNEATTHLKPIASHFLVPGLNTLQIVLKAPLSSSTTPSCIGARWTIRRLYRSIPRERHANSAPPRWIPRPRF